MNDKKDHEMILSPTPLAILLYFFINQHRPRKANQLTSSGPGRVKYLNKLRELGLIHSIEFAEDGNSPSTGFGITDKGRAHVGTLCMAPLPVTVWNSRTCGWLKED